MNCRLRYLKPKIIYLLSVAVCLFAAGSMIEMSAEAFDESVFVDCETRAMKNSLSPEIRHDGWFSGVENQIQLGQHPEAKLTQKNGSTIVVKLAAHNGNIYAFWFENGRSETRWVDSRHLSPIDDPLTVVDRHIQVPKRAFSPEEDESLENAESIYQRYKQSDADRKKAYDEAQTLHEKAGQPFHDVFKTNRENALATILGDINVPHHNNYQAKYFEEFGYAPVEGESGVYRKANGAKLEFPTVSIPLGEDLEALSRERHKLQEALDNGTSYRHPKAPSSHSASHAGTTSAEDGYRSRLRNDYGKWGKDGEAYFEFGYYKSEIQEMKQAHPFLRNVPDEDIFSFLVYEGPGAFEINEALRSGNPELLLRHQDVITGLKSFLPKMPKFEGWVSRYISKIDAAQLERYKPGAIIEEKAFTSAKNGSVQDLARNFSTMLSDQMAFMRIKSKSGRDIQIFSAGEENAEKEIVFPPGSKFKVISTETIENPYHRLHPNTNPTAELITLEEM
jgi:hypothetical protein